MTSEAVKIQRTVCYSWMLCMNQCNITIDCTARRIRFSEHESIAALGMGKLDASCMPMADMTDTPQLHVVFRGIPCAACME